MNFSIIKKSQLESTLRLDAEYYQPEYLEFEKKIKAGPYKLWRDIEGKFITGPFGSEFNVENYVVNGKHRYVRGKDVKEFFLLNDDNVYIPEKDFERLKKYTLAKGDILVSVVGTLGNTAIVGEDDLPAIFSCKSTAFRTGAIDPYYFLAYLNSKYGRGFLERSVRGTVQTGLNIDDLKNLPVYFPSIEKQQAIGLMIVESKKELENSKSLHTQAQDLLLDVLGLKDMDRDESLSWIINLSDAKAVGRVDAEYFQPKYKKLISVLSKGETQHLAQIATESKGGIKIEPKKLYSYSEISDVNTGNGEVVFSQVLGRDLPANAKNKVGGGELIISKVRPTRGAVAIVPEEWKRNHIVSGAFCVYQCESPLREYLQIFLRSIAGKLQLEKPTTGTSYPTVDDEDVRNLVVPILPKLFQQKIADLVQRSHEARKRSKELLGEAKRKVEELIDRQT